MPLCYGRLNLTTNQIEDMCICEINAMADGWRQRFYDQQDLYILYCALPVYQTQCKKPPKYEDFIKNRPDHKDNLDDLSLEDIKYLAEED